MYFERLIRCQTCDQNSLLFNREALMGSRESWENTNLIRLPPCRLRTSSCGTAETNGEDFYIHDTSIQQRELFSSEATDTLPITSLRGKCKVVQYSDLRSASHFVPCPDHFFYILAYRPDNRRLATTQGEIRVGPSHQARLPECRPGTSPADMPEKCETREEIRWRPGRVVDGDLLMYLRAARSIAAFAGMVGGSADDRCEAEAMDETTVNALDTLHKHNYDTSKSLQALVKGPAVMYIEKKWSEEDVVSTPFVSRAMICPGGCG
ncbi:arginine-glutamic acid dipeptide repeats protein [Elysia marginata]|uniref:Arginine-glutamic acid dipeptide repeats protein n=1 Tax=Elysia marginata TaxID=1093978 RepID=A0AAV4HI49_9GAST|nr:arginine-glutamic acid dipeptide repeats protein [Elysia marginata]